MEPIGYVPVQIIPSLDGVFDSMDKQLGGKLGVIGKKGGKQLAKGVGDGLKDLEREVESASKAYDKFRDKAADALEKITVEEKKLAKARAGGKEDQIAAAEARVSKARRDSARATKDAEDANRSLESSQRRLGDHTGDLDGRFGKLSGSMRSVGAVAGGAALAGIAALGAGAVVAGTQIYDLGKGLDDLSDSLEIKTGLSGAGLDALADSVTRLGTTDVPSTFGQIGDVAAEVTRNLHLSGPEFDAVTSRLANLKRMGVDVDVRNLGKAFRGFGVDAKDQAPALNSLYEASTKSGLSIDDLTAAAVKGGPALRQLGLDFGESAGLVASFEDAGLDGEKAMAALNKSFAYFSKEGIPVKQGLQDIIEKIQSLGDAPEAGELATKVFGGKGGAAFLEAIQNGTLDLESLRSTLQSTGLDINQVSDDTADWSEKWQDIKNEAAAAVEPLASGFFDSVNSGLSELSDFVLEHKTDIIDFFTNIGVAVLKTGDTLGQLASSTLRMGADFLDVLNTVGLGFKGLFENLARVGKAMSFLPGPAGEFGEALSKLGDSISDFTSEAPDGMRKTADAIDSMRKPLPDLIDAWKDAGERAKAADKPTFEWGKTIEGVGDKADATRTQVKGLADALVNFGNLPIPPGILGPVPGGGLVNPLDVIAGNPPGGPAGPLGGLGNTVGAAILRDTGRTPSGPQSRAAANAIEQLFGDRLRGPIGGSRDNNTAPGTHDAGLSIDIPIGPDQKALGDEINAWLQAHAQELGLKYSIWRDTGRNVDGSTFNQPGHQDHIDAHFNGASTPYQSGTPVDITGGGAIPGFGAPGSQQAIANMIYQQAIGRGYNAHEAQSIVAYALGESSLDPSRSGGVQGDAEVLGLFQEKPGFAIGGGIDPSQRTDAVANTTAYLNQLEKNRHLPIEQALPATSVGGPLASGPGAQPQDWDRLMAQAAAYLSGGGLNYRDIATGGPTSPGQLNNAFGPGYEPGIGTPGFDEYGKPGYFEVDPKAVREAGQRIDDQAQRIIEADEAAQQAQAAIDDLEADANQAERDAAIARKAKADYAARVARRELDDLKGELGEAQKGKFNAAGKASGAGSGGGAAGFRTPSSLSGFGSAIGSFFDGQIGSALEVFGIGDSPPWLQGISKFISGIKVSDASGNSVFDGSSIFGGGGGAPKAASPAFGAPPAIEGDGHGSRAGQAPGPVFAPTFNTNDDTMFQKWKRWQDEQTASRLGSK